VTLQIDPTLLVGFLFAAVRTAAWIAVAPPFNSSGIPAKVKVAVSVSLAFVLAPHYEGGVDPLDTAAFFGGLLYQALAGLALGFGVLVLFSSFQAAGSMIDLSAAFSSATMYDPFSNAAASPMARLYQVLAITILFVTDGHLMLVRGLLASFEAAPLDGLQLESVASTLIADLGNFFVAAVQIAFPMLAALFLAEVVLGLLSRAAPQLNILVIGFNVKIMLLLLLGGLALVVLPGAVQRVVEQITTSSISMFGG
jgi:flagellar biosynthetic protein FliR